jgi:outer membrane protein OmpA-like peptidoglycan-associated protein
MKNKKESFFWTSYSDLMTSLFFVMLVLFVLVIALLHKKISEQALKLEEFEKIEEIKKSLNNIDSAYFSYNPEYKKHILKIRVNFPTGESAMDYIDYDTRYQLQKAGQAVKKQMDEVTKTNPEIQYLLIIEGQASKDNYAQNYELSYERALALNRFWESSGIDFGKNCEVLISGSGAGGSMRDSYERNNQRFLIHLIPKTGEIEQKTNEN